MSSEYDEMYGESAQQLLQRLPRATRSNIFGRAHRLLLDFEQSVDRDVASAGINAGNPVHATAILARLALDEATASVDAMRIRAIKSGCECGAAE